MKWHITRKNLSIILSLSGIYLVVLCILLFFVHSHAAPIVGIIFVSFISWKNGVIAGLILTVINHFCNGIAFNFFAPEYLLPAQSELLISISVHIGVSFLLGYFGELAANLRNEIERRKQVEASLRSLQNELELRVEMRTRELQKANELLYQARKMEIIGQITGTIAHDFNNFLSIILGYSSLIIKTLDPKQAACEYAHIIEKTACTAAEITSQLLTFARKKKFTPQVVNLNELVIEMMPLLSSLIKNGVTINYITESKLPLLHGGIDQIKSAVLNLCLNARDAMENGGEITITTKMMQITPEVCKKHSVNCQEGNYSTISITDTGSGIEDKVLKHLFEPFFTTKEAGKGTGMGLAAVYGIMQSHKGAVFVETEIGKSTTFTMAFPVLTKECQLLPLDHQNSVA